MHIDTCFAFLAISSLLSVTESVLIRAILPNLIIKVGFPLTLRLNWAPAHRAPTMDAIHKSSDEDEWLLKLKLLKSKLENLQTRGFHSSDDKNCFFETLYLCQSPRTQLALVAIAYIGQVAAMREGQSYFYANENLLDHGLTTLIKLCGSSKKLVSSAAESALQNLFTVASITKILHHLQYVVNDKNAGLRERISRSLFMTIQSNMGKWGNKKYWGELESVLIKLVCDASVTVRSIAVKIVQLFEEILPIETRDLVTSKLDPIASRQIKQNLFAGFTKMTLSNHHAFKDGTSEELSDDKIIIPMQKITLNKVESPHCETPSAVKGLQQSLCFCTPYKNKLLAEEPPSSPISPSKLPFDALFTQLKSGTMQKSLWKKLEIMADIENIGGERISSIIDVILQRYSEVTIEQVGLLGLALKKLLSSVTEDIPFSNSLIELLVKLSREFSEQQLQLLWIDPPLSWAGFDAIKFITLLEYASVNPSAFSLILNFLNRHLDQDLCLSQPDKVLASLHALWGTRSGLDLYFADYTRLIVSCMTKIRVIVGEAVFFQALPSLSISQKNLLNAYLFISL